MVEVCVALIWIAMSVASAKGLSALAHAATMSDVEAELMALAGEGPRAHDGLFHVDAFARLPLRSR
jgi:hypothetical protein